MTAVISGLGTAVPSRVVGNDELAQTLDTSDEWIRSRTGIGHRRIAAPDTATGDLAVEAGAAALKSSGAATADAVLVATMTPDQPCPATAPVVAARLGLGPGLAFDLNAACSGFVFGLATAAGLIAGGIAQRVLLIGADVMSRTVDPADRNTAVLFGDGAGAVVVAGGELELGCGGFVLGTDASQADMLYAERVDPMLRMEGREVYRHAIRRMVAATTAAIERAGLTIDDIDLFVAHQANVRIINSAAAEMGLPPEKVMVNIDRVANTSSASIPLALEQAEREGRLKPGGIVALSAFGAGFVWGSGVVSWKERAHVCA